MRLFRVTCWDAETQERCHFFQPAHDLAEAVVICEDNEGLTAQQAYEINEITGERMGDIWTPPPKAN